MRNFLLSAALFLAVVGFSIQPARGQSQTGDPGQVLFQMANHERTARGIAPLKWSASLAQAAREHALRMAQQNTLSHQLPGEPAMEARASRAGARFSSLAENIAEGPSAENIHQQWMNSAPHRANLLDPQLDSIGIAVAANSGTLFAVEDFSLAGGTLSLQDQEGVVGGLLQKDGLHLLAYTADARRSCVLDNGYAGNHIPSFVLHYATTDLQTLPDMLEQRIQTGKYHSAVVGACQGNAKSGPSGYRLAVLLYE